MKRFTLICVLIFSFIFLCGCDKKESKEFGADYIMLSSETFKEGQICQSIRFGVNRKNLSQISSSLKEEMDFIRNLTDEVNLIRSEFLVTYAISYIKNPIEEFKIGSGVALTQCSYDSEKDYVGFDIIFPSIEAWNFYHQKEDASDDAREEPKQNLFLNKYQTKSLFPFATQNKDQKFVGQIYKERYLNAAKNLSFEGFLRDNYDPDFVYSYSSFSKSLNSNADLILHGKDKYFHIWIVNGKDLNENLYINLHLTVVNKGYWILYTLLIALAGMGASIIIVKFKRIREKKRHK